MVVDPGILKSQQELVNALAKENLTVEDVNFVFITHSHIDHYRNIGMFPKAKTLEYFGIWDEDYLCIVNFEKDEVKGVKLTSRKQDIAEAVKWKSQILKKSVKILACHT